ncbi:hypothetical protein AVEN_71793-1 [Araneus ventricosus]|uniref:Uncharacterized protein n=1 Tax=Araneus ventricosus TaxID=182803 RepID=A0A4Y2UDQ7_ARAVE|nr:hypothetical protein AVEN_71793-1 [Araneus ventricosus]
MDTRPTQVSQCVEEKSEISNPSLKLIFEKTNAASNGLISLQKSENGEGRNQRHSLDPYQRSSEAEKQNSIMLPHPETKNAMVETSRPFVERRNNEIANQSSKPLSAKRRRNIAIGSLKHGPNRSENNAYQLSNPLSNSGITDDANQLSHPLSDRSSGDGKNRSPNILPGHRSRDATSQLLSPFNGGRSIYSANQHSNCLPDMATKDEGNPCSKSISDETRKNEMNQSLDILSHQSGEMNEELTRLFNKLFVKAEGRNPSSECNASKIWQIVVLIPDQPFDSRTNPIQADNDSVDQPFETHLSNREASNPKASQCFEQGKCSNHASHSQTKEQSHYEINNCEESYTLADDLSRLAIKKKLGSDVTKSNKSKFFIKQKQDPEASSVNLSRPIIKNKKQKSKIQSNNEARFLTNESAGSDVTSDKPPRCLISEKEGSGISYNKSRQLLMSKNKGPDSSSYKPPPFPISKSEGSDASSDNRSQFFSETRQESIAPSAFLTEVVYRNEPGSEEQSKKPLRFLTNNSGVLDVLPNETPSLPISMSERSNASSNNQLPYYNNKKQGANFRTVYPSQPMNENRKRSKARFNIPPRFMVSNREGPDAPSDYHSRPFIKILSYSTCQGSNSDDEPSRFVASGNQGSNPGDEPSRFVANGNQGSNVQFDGPFSLLINKNKAAEYSKQSGFYISKNRGSNQYECTQNSASKGYFNIFVAGPENCGKIQLIKAFVGTSIAVSKIFNSSCVAVKTDERTGVGFKIWYVRNLRTSLLFIAGICSREKSVILLVYNIIKHETLSDIDDYIKDVRGRLGSRVPIVLVGNKVDARTPTTISEFDKAGRRINSFDDGHEMKEKHELQDFLECSGKTRDGVLEIFRRAAELAVYRQVKK